MREEQVKQWAAETLVALEALHEQGVLCRDLNPRNLLLDQAGRCPRPAGRGVGHPPPPPSLRWGPLKAENESSPKSKGTQGLSASCHASPQPFHAGLC